MMISFHDVLVLFIAFFCLFASVFGFWIMRLQERLGYARALFKDCANVGDTGIILFEANESFLYVNACAQEFIMLFDHVKRPNLSALLDYFYDHAVEVQEGLIQTLKHSAMIDAGDQFREVIRTRGGVLYLVEIKKTPGQKTVVLLKSLEYFVAQEEKVLKLTRMNERLNQAELFKAEKLDALGRLSAGVAHDFNNLLSIIDGYVSMIGGCLNDREKVLIYIDKIKTASIRGARLTKQMLTFSQHKIVANDVIDLSRVLEDQRNFLGAMFEECIEVKVEIEEPDLYARASADGIIQILLNLCINARDAMPKGGRISISLGVCGVSELPHSIIDIAPEEEFLCLRVADTGEGMSADIQEKIFDPFFTTKAQGKGSGLGLSVVYGVVQEMAGYIHVTSQIGAGSVFYIHIPRSSQHPKQAFDNTLVDVGEVDLDGYCVLVVEDEEDLRSLICDVLTQKGMRVLSAAHGEDALVLQDGYEGVIDLLVTDVVMPGMSGLKLAELMQALRENLGVIFISGYPANGHMAQVSLPDDAYFMAKPIDYELLCRLIHVCLGDDDEDDKGQIMRMTAAHWATQEPRDSKKNIGFEEKEGG